MAFEEIRRFSTNNCSSPLAVKNALVTLALNGEYPGTGRFAKRRGIDTAVTINLQVGVAAPFRVFPWRVGSNTYVIAVGSDGLAFIGTNNYLYARTSAHAHIFSDGNAAAEKLGAETAPNWAGAGKVSDSWGLAVPTTASVVTKVVASSSFAPGWYAHGFSAYSSVRNVRSPFTRFTATASTAPFKSTWATSKLQQVEGMTECAGIPTVTATAGDYVDFWRALILSGSETVWQWEDIFTRIPHRVGTERLLRYFDRRAVANGAVAGVWNDVGGQVEGPLFDYCTDTVPFCKSVALWDARFFYVRGNAAADTYRVYYSTPGCPETYGGSVYSILGQYQDGVIQGEAYFSVPSDCGPVTGIVQAGGQLLVLCEAGAWRVVKSDAGKGLYEVSPDNLWVGCVSHATIAYSPVGVWWLAKEGVVLWAHGDVPRVVTDGVIDTAGTDTPFATEVNGLVPACGAYDVKRRQYVVRIPKPTSGQFALCISPNGPQEEPDISVWTFGSEVAAITGMGYDWSLGEIVYLVGTTTVTGYRMASAYADYKSSGAGTYAFGATMLFGANVPKRRREETEDSNSLGCRVFINRSDVTAAATMTVDVRGMPTAETSGGSADEQQTLTWAISEYKAQETSPIQRVRGRVFQVTLANTDTKPMEINTVQLFQAGDRPATLG